MASLNDESVRTTLLMDPTLPREIKLPTTAEDKLTREDLARYVFKTDDIDRALETARRCGFPDAAYRRFGANGGMTVFRSRRHVQEWLDALRNCGRSLR